MKGLCRSRLVIPLPRLLAGVLAVGIGLFAAAPAGAAPALFVSPGTALTASPLLPHRFSPLSGSSPTAASVPAR